MVDSPNVDASMMTNEIDYVDDEPNVNEQILHDMMIDRHNNHFENDENNPILKVTLQVFPCSFEIFHI